MQANFAKYPFSDLCSGIKAIETFEIDQVSDWENGIPWLTIDEVDNKSFDRILQTPAKIQAEGNFHKCAILLHNGFSVCYYYALIDPDNLDLPLAEKKDLIISLKTDMVDREYLTWVLLALARNDCLGKPAGEFSINLSDETEIPLPVNMNGTPDLEVQREIARNLALINKDILAAYQNGDSIEKVNSILLKGKKYSPIYSRYHNANFLENLFPDSMLNTETRSLIII